MLKKPQTMLLNSCAACVSLSLSVTLPMSFENDPPVGVGSAVSVLADLAGRIVDICPLVFKIAPLDRSSMNQPFTPGFLDKRCRDSSTASVPLDNYKISYVDRLQGGKGGGSTH